MDIIALGKASKVFQDLKQMDEELIAAKAEGRFTSVDARLDWLEAQASGLQAKDSYEVDLSQGTFDDAEFKEGSIQLRQIGSGAFVGDGTWESEIVDLGSGMQKVTGITIKLG